MLSTPASYYPCFFSGSIDYLGWRLRSELLLLFCSPSVFSLLNSVSFHSHFSKLSSVISFLPSIRSSTQVLPSFSPIAPFDVREYFRLHAPCPDVKGFQYMPLRVIEIRRTTPNMALMVCQQCAAGLNVWKHWGDRAIVLSYDKPTYADVPFICCTTKELYENSLALVVRSYFEQVDNALITHSLENVMFSLPYDILKIFVNSEYRFTELYFVYRLWVPRNAALFVIWHWIDIFCIPTWIAKR